MQDYAGEARLNLLLHKCDLDNVPTVVGMTMIDFGFFFKINYLASYIYIYYVNIRMHTVHPLVLLLLINRSCGVEDGRNVLVVLLGKRFSR